jgi:DNA-binding NarL/FixJ family response regulator
MDDDIIRTILPLLTPEIILHVHNVVGSQPVSFAMLRHEILKQLIEEGLKNEMRDEEIARKAGVCKRTVERYKRNKLLRHRNGTQ